MRQLLACAVLSACLAFAQNTAVFPNATATSTDLPIASNNYSSTLTLGINATATTVTVPSTSGFTAPGLITINSEVIAVCAVASGTSFTVGKSSCPNLDGRGYDNTVAASHIANQTVAGRITARHINQMAAEIISVESWLRSTIVSVTQFGAKCDGTTDDTTAVQAAINSISANGKVLVPGICSVGNLYLSSKAIGAIIEGTTVQGAGVTVGGQNPTGGFVAKTGTTGALFSNYASQVTLRDLTFDCHARCANPLLLVNAQGGVLSNVTAMGGTDSGFLLYNEGGPKTTLTSSITSGTVNPIFTVANAALTGYPLSGTGQVGGNSCDVLIIDWNTANQEGLSFSRSGNTITASGTAAHNHSPGAVVQCHGNNNALRLNYVRASGNGAAGIDIKQGSDNNSIGILFPDMESNVTFGALLSGTQGKIVGGTFQGNASGPVQLGDATGGGAVGTNGRQTVSWDLDGLQDMESGGQSVISVCDLYSHMEFSLASQLSFGAVCSGGTQSTQGHGYDLAAGNITQHTIKTVAGTIVARTDTGWCFYDASAILQSCYGPTSTSVKGSTSVVQILDSSAGGGTYTQFKNGGTSKGYLGVDTSGNCVIGFLDPSGLSTRICVDASGNWGVGTTTPTYLFDVNGVIRAQTYKSSDGTSGVTGGTCSAWKNGLCVAP